MTTPKTCLLNRIGGRFFFTKTKQGRGRKARKRHESTKARRRRGTKERREEGTIGRKNERTKIRKNAVIANAYFIKWIIIG
jgi:hypothetical protein